MTKCSDYIKREFPLIDDDLKQYVEGNVPNLLVCCFHVKLIQFHFKWLDVLKNGADDFEDSEEVYEAVGEVLQEISCDKSEADIKQVFVTHVSLYFVCRTWIFQGCLPAVA